MEAELRITPRTLNLRSRGNWVNAQLSIGSDEDIDLDNLDLESFMLMGSIPAENVRAWGNRVIMKFDRAALSDILAGSGAEADVTVTGSTLDGLFIEASDTIRIIQ